MTLLVEDKSKSKSSNVSCLLVRDSTRLPTFDSPVILTIGNFDGLHRGHQALLSKMSQLGDANSTKVVMSFYPHPAEVLGRAPQVKKLTSWRTMLDLLSAQSISILYLKHFTTEFSRLSVDDFCQELILAQLQARHLVIGSDAAVGRDRLGTPDKLKEVLEPKGCEVHVEQFVTSKSNEKISSRDIRAAIESGNLTQAERALGRRFAIEGRVSQGDKRGRELGYPTANVLPKGQLVPCYGIYATRVRLRGVWYNAATNVGISPTFESKQEKVEAFLIDYSGPEFYQEQIVVEFIEYIRPEQRFDDVASLIAQMENDVSRIKEILHA